MTFWKRLKFAISILRNKHQAEMCQALLSEDGSHFGTNMIQFLDRPAYKMALKAVDKVNKDSSLKDAADSVKRKEAIEWAIKYFHHYKGERVPFWEMLLGIEVAVGSRKGKL